MRNGGAREGAGRPKGSRNAETIEKRGVERIIQKRRLRVADRLFNAQFRAAEGVHFVYRIDRIPVGKGFREEHVLVTSPEEIKMFLDSQLPNAEAGETDGYYYITTEKPDVKALIDMADRTFGKPVQRTAITDTEGDDLDLGIDLERLDANQLDQLAGMLSRVLVARVGEGGPGEDEAAN